MLHREIHTETLVDYDQENNQSGHELDHVRKVVLPVEGLTQWVLSAVAMSRWKRAMIAPSNSVPRFVWRVMGEKAFQMIDSQMFVAMKRKFRTQDRSPSGGVHRREDDEAGEEELQDDEDGVRSVHLDRRSGRTFQRT